MAESRHERRTAARQPRLDQPRDDRRVTLRPTYDAEAFGRASETIARFLGTGRYLVIQTIIVVLWIGYNGVLTFTHYVKHVGPTPFDKYPFIFLTLILSLQASYAAPLILLAQNRQDDRDRVNLDQDRADNAQQHADTEFVARELASVRIALGEVVTRDFLRSELRAILEELDTEGGHKKDRKKKRKVDLPEPGPEPAAAVDAEPAPLPAE